VSLDAAILGFLGECPRTGYDLKTRCFDGPVKDFWNADQAQIYRTLERLQTDQLVSVLRKRQSRKPDRKIYSLTDAGRARLAEWLGSDLSVSAPREPFLLQLFFGESLSDEDLATRLSRHRELRQTRLDSLRHEASISVQGSPVPTRRALLRDAAFDGAISAERAVIDWLDDLMEALEAGKLPPLTESDAPASCSDTGMADTVTTMEGSAR